MIIEYCDICGKPLKSEIHTRYKLKREWELGSGWIRLSIHDKCWHSLCDFFNAMEEDRKIREQREREEE